MADVWVTNAGAGLQDGSSLANAYAADDLAQAMVDLSAASTGSILRICGDITTTAAQTVSAAVADTTSDDTAPKMVQGRDAADTADARVTITTAITTGAILTLAGANEGISGLVWRDITFDAEGKAGVDCLYWGASNFWDAHVFHRCAFLNGKIGCYALGTGKHVFNRCAFMGNASHGYSGGNSRGSADFFACRMINNGGWGVTGMSLALQLWFCVVSYNTSGGVNFVRHINQCVAINCTIDHNGGPGIIFDVAFSQSLMSNSSAPMAINNLITSNGTYGIEFGCGDPSAANYTEDLIAIEGNVLFGNISGTYAETGAYPPGLGAYVAANNTLAGSDPTYTDDTLAGGLDYSLPPGSAVIGEGLAVDVTDGAS